MTIKASIRELKNSPTKYIHQCHTEPIEITNHGNTVGYIVPPQMMNIQNSYSINTVSSLRSEDTNTLKEENEK